MDIGDVIRSLSNLQANTILLVAGIAFLLLGLGVSIPRYLSVSEKFTPWLSLAIGGAMILGSVAVGPRETGPVNTPQPEKDFDSISEIHIEGKLSLPIPSHLSEKEIEEKVCEIIDKNIKSKVKALVDVWILDNDEYEEYSNKSLIDSVNNSIIEEFDECTPEKQIGISNNQIIYGYLSAKFSLQDLDDYILGFIKSEIGRVEPSNLDLSDVAHYRENIKDSDRNDKLFR